MTPFERHHGDYVISTDSERLDVGLIHSWLSQESYWAKGRTRAVVERSLASSINFGAYAPDGTMVGAARVVTDHATFGWLCDVFVLDEHRGHGLGIALIDTVMEHPDLSRLQRLILVTADAHGLYSRFGFRVVDTPERWMVVERPQG